MTYLDTAKIEFLKSKDDLLFSEGVISNLKEIVKYRDEINKSIHVNAMAMFKYTLNEDEVEEIFGIYVDSMMREDRVFCPEVYRIPGQEYKIWVYLKHWTKYAVARYMCSIKKDKVLCLTTHTYYEKTELIMGDDYSDLIEKGMEMQHKIGEPIFENLIAALRFGSLINKYILEGNKKLEVRDIFKLSFKDKGILKEACKENKEWIFLVKDILELYNTDEKILDKMVHYIIKYKEIKRENKAKFGYSKLDFFCERTVWNEEYSCCY